MSQNLRQQTKRKDNANKKTFSFHFKPWEGFFKFRWNETGNLCCFQKLCFFWDKKFLKIVWKFSKSYEKWTLAEFKKVLIPLSIDYLNTVTKQYFLEKTLEGVRNKVWSACIGHNQEKSGNQEWIFLLRHLNYDGILKKFNLCDATRRLGKVFYWFR